MPRPVKLTNIDCPLDTVYVEAIADGVPVRFSVLKAALDALPTRTAKQLLLATTAIEQLDDRQRGRYAELLGDIEVIGTPPVPGRKP